MIVMLSGLSFGSLSLSHIYDSNVEWFGSLSLSHIYDSNVEWFGSLSLSHIYDSNVEWFGSLSLSHIFSVISMIVMLSGLAVCLQSYLR